MKNYQEWVGALAAGLLILAIFTMPYEYYIFLRWVITAVSIYVAIYLGGLENNKLWFFVIIAILFNPIFPFYSDRSFWFFADLISAGLFLAFSKNKIKLNKEK